jgi:hypothetical protein
MSLAGNGNKGKGSRTISRLDAKLDHMIGHTFHGSHVKIRGPNEPETEIECDQRVHGGDRKRTITIQRKGHIGITCRLANDEHEGLLSTNNDLHGGEHLHSFGIIGDDTHLFSARIRL